MDSRDLFSAGCPASGPLDHSLLGGTLRDQEIKIETYGVSRLKIENLGSKFA